MKVYVMAAVDHEEYNIHHIVTNIDIARDYLEKKKNQDLVIDEYEITDNPPLESGWLVAYYKLTDRHVAYEIATPAKAHRLEDLDVIVTGDLAYSAHVLAVTEEEALDKLKALISEISDGNTKTK